DERLSARLASCLSPCEFVLDLVGCSASWTGESYHGQPLSIVGCPPILPAYKPKVKRLPGVVFTEILAERLKRGTDWKGGQAHLHTTEKEEGAFIALNC